MPYAQINLVVDIALIAILSLALLPKHPKFVLAVFALYLIPWIFPLSKSGKNEFAAISKSWEIFQSSPKTPKAKTQSFNPPTAFNSSDSAQTTLGKTQELYRHIFQALGGATGATLSADPQDLDSPQSGNLFEKTSNLPNMLGRFDITPDAVWFYLRLFWLAAAFTLWIQNSYLGILALIPSLLPVFYLARAIPLAYEKIQKNPWMQQASKTVSDERTGNALLAQYSGICIAILVAMPTFFLVLLFWRQMKILLGRKLEKYLKPDLYQVRLNGHLIDFSRDQEDLVIEGMRLKCARLVQKNRKRPEIWQLDSGTVIEFVPRQAA